MTRYMRAAALAAALLIGSAATAGAQGGPPGGGRRTPEMMASLDGTLNGVDGVTAAQKDTLTKLAAAYTAKFGTANTAMREAMMAARQAGGPPDMAAMMKMREGMNALRKEELAAARALLTGAQTGKFDENVKAEVAEAAERDAQMRQRMGGNPPE
jgi:ABC-type amino acid transport substrate-binding protein